MKKNPRNYDPSTGEKSRRIKIEMVFYCLSIDSQQRLSGNLLHLDTLVTHDENISERKIYPWNGASLRNSSNKNQGEIMANFKRGRGDNMGVSGNLNDNADITGPVDLIGPMITVYNMAGNVSEWVLDVYRPVIEQTLLQILGLLKCIYDTEKDEDGFIAEKDSLGRM